MQPHAWHLKHRLRPGVASLIRMGIFFHPTQNLHNWEGGYYEEHPHQLCIFHALLPLSLAHFKFKAEMNRFEFFEINYHHCHRKCICCHLWGIERGGGHLDGRGVLGGATSHPLLSQAAPSTGNPASPGLTWPHPAVLTAPTRSSSLTRQSLQHQPDHPVHSSEFFEHQN